MFKKRVAASNNSSSSKRMDSRESLATDTIGVVRAIRISNIVEAINDLGDVVAIGAEDLVEMRAARAVNTSDLKGRNALRRLKSIPTLTTGYTMKKTTSSISMCLNKRRSHLLVMISNFSCLRTGTMRLKKALKSEYSALSNSTCIFHRF